MLIIVYFFFLVFCLLRLQINKTGYNTNYLSKDNCNIVKGFFILMVFISHINQYIRGCGYDSFLLGDRLYFKITSSIGQLMVVMFLFFSGYGIMESYKKKGINYIKTMPKKRIITTLLNFDIAVLFFIVLNLFLGKLMSIKQIFLSFIAWESVGNSNWYIFCILICYSISFVILYLYHKFFVSKSIYTYALLPILVLSLVTMITLSYHRPPYCYNTMLCFPFGMLYSMIKEEVEAIVQHHYFKSIASFVVLFLVFRGIQISIKGLIFNMESIAFVMIIALLMMKVESDNKWLRWMGQNLFPLYIYQRLSMMAIYEVPGGKDFIASFPILYIVICFICTLFITSQYHRWQIKL